MFRQDDDGADPDLPRWLVPWVYPVGLGIAGLIVGVLLWMGYLG